MKKAIQILIEKDCYQESIPRLNIQGRVISTNVDKFVSAMDEYNKQSLDELLQFLYNEIIERRHYSASKSFEVVIDKIKEIRGI